VRRAGGTPIILPFLEAPSGEELDALVSAADAVILTGGDDFDMERLGLGATHPRATPTPASKQDFDLALARLCLERGLPTLGICYGMQLLALAEGGRLYQHLPEDLPDAAEHAGGVQHAVHLGAETKLASLLGVQQLSVISCHHQALSAVTGPWSVAGTDEQGLIEAIERADHPFAIGVQWHPELSPTDSPHSRLFEGLVEAASRQVTTW
jgi:putative glutamine amidotransferase